MRWLDSVEWPIVAFCGGVGLTWTMLAIAAAFSLNVPLGTADPVGVVRGALLLPVEATVVFGSLLTSAGFYHDTDILGLALAVGLGGGLTGGLLAVLLSHRYALL